jgi:hypothetical protein
MDGKTDEVGDAVTLPKSINRFWANDRSGSRDSQVARHKKKEGGMVWEL